jgi:putative SOS response-associated peptidase YedK
MRKGQFRKHFKERRCVIPCESFYDAMVKGDSRVAFATPG